MSLPKRATLAVPIVTGDWLELSDTGAQGLFRHVGDTALTRLPLFGVAAQDVATTDTTTNPIAVEVPLENYVEWEFDTDSDGGLVASDVGGLRDIDTLGRNVDRSVSASKQIRITKLVSATKGWGVLNRGALFFGGPYTT